jgi:hypothetical protein
MHTLHLPRREKDTFAVLRSSGLVSVPQLSRLLARHLESGLLLFRSPTRRCFPDATQLRHHTSTDPLRASVKDQLNSFATVPMVRDANLPGLQR